MMQESCQILTKKIKKHRAIVLNFERLLSVLHIDQKWFDSLLDYDSDIYHCEYTQAIAEGKTEAEAEDLALEAESREQADRYSAIMRSLESIADQCFERLGLAVVKDSSDHWLVSPVNGKDWHNAANEIRECVNGYGPFYFSSLREFLDSGPYTAREAVDSHLGYIGSYADVYGDYSAKYLLEKSFRYIFR